MVSSLPSASSGLERDKFDNKTVSFEEHIKFEHNMWNYLYFIVLVRVKNKTDYTGPESYVAQMIKVWEEQLHLPALTLRARQDSCRHLLEGRAGRGAEQQLEPALGYSGAHQLLVLLGSLYAFALALLSGTHVP